MFALKMGRLTPKVNAALTISKYSSRKYMKDPQPLGILRDINWQAHSLRLSIFHLLPPSVQINGPQKFLVDNSMFAPFAITAARFSSNQEQPAPQSPPPPPLSSKRVQDHEEPIGQLCEKPRTEPSRQSPKQQPQPDPQIPIPTLPNREQLEKFFFRTLAFIWDVSYVLYIKGRKYFEKYVVENPTVQMYWKEFLARMEKSKKD